MPAITALFGLQRTNANDRERRSGAPGRTRTSTMLPPPDFESGASTNSATGAGGRDHSGEARGVNGHASAERAPAKRAPFFRNEAQTHARARAGAQGSAARSCPFCLCPRSLIRSCGPWVPGLAALARDTRERRIPSRAEPAHVTSARVPSPHSRARRRRSCRPGPRALAPAPRPSARRDPPRTSPRPACRRDA